MANLTAVTASNGATVTDPQAVRGLCRGYCLGSLHWDVDESNELVIWGPDRFQVYPRKEEGKPDFEDGPVTHEFLRSLTDYIEEGEEFDIQSAGFTKCRFPVYASRYLLRDGEVLHADLNRAEPIDS